MCNKLEQCLQSFIPIQGVPKLNVKRAPGDRVDQTRAGKNKKKNPSRLVK